MNDTLPSRLRCLMLPTAVCGLLLLCSLPSLLIAKKIVALLVLPPGLLWLGLMVLAGWPGLRRGGRSLVALVLLGYTLTGNPWLGGWLLGCLESPYVAVSQPAQRFDAICVLGGGSSARPDGTPQLGPAGDRLLEPARMFLAGKTEYLVASGLNVTDGGGTRSLADDTAALWRDLGIPETAIIRLSEPRTTKEEILAYKALIAGRSWQRVGVCSSAWHLRRVEAICRNEGLLMIPLPADFLSGRLPWNPMYAVPQARGFHNVQKALWEYLGSWNLPTNLTRLRP
ncbi:MAG: YdcF family protein [Verrucomicrobiota bacterium]